MINLVGVVILYHPNVKETLDNIRTYAGHLNKLIVYDNSVLETPSLADKLANLGLNIHYQYFGCNDGISKRLNQAAKEAIEEGYTHLLMMDQDSSFGQGIFEKYIQLVNKSNYDQIAQFGVNTDPCLLSVSENPTQTNHLITSGTIINLNIFQIIGNFDENLFIDYVDFEYAYRAMHFGYLNLKYDCIPMKHSLGYRKEGISFLTFKKSARIIHPPIRVYYIIRNGLYLLFKLPYMSTTSKREVKKSLWILKNDFLYHQNKIAVVSHFLQGISDFLLNKMGKKVN